MKRALSRKNAWERLPTGLKAPLGAALSLVPLPYLLGRRFRRTLARLREAERWPGERARQHQVEELRRVCGLAQRGTSFYRAAFAAAGFEPEDLRRVEDLRGLPTIDRQTVQDRLAEMCTVPPTAPGVDYVSTGGTGGAPLRFYIGAGRSAVEYAHLMAGWGRVGFRPGDTLAVFRGRVVAEDGHGLRHEHDPLLRHHYYSNFHMTEADMARYLDHLRGIGPCFLHVYPSSAANLARFLRRAGRERPANVRGVIAESEIVYPEQRRLVEEVLGVRYFSGYGHTEKVLAAAECEQTADYHFWPTYGFVELLDEAGRPVTTPGQRGEIVGTGFINTVVPFIRYRTGDYATYVGDGCGRCGRAQVVLADIRGHRIQEVLVTRAGTHVSWTALNMHDDTFERVLRFQFYQDTPGVARLRVVPGAGFGREDEERIRRRLGEKLTGQVDFALELVEAISGSALGKAIYVDQRIPDLTAPSG